MKLKERQKEFDVIKWYDSVLAGEDKCGSYNFCVKCRKEETYPCARAEHRYNNVGYYRLAVIRRHRGK